VLCWIWGVATTLCRKTLSSRPFSVERTFRPKSVCCSHWAFLILLFSPRTLNQILKIKRCSDSGIFQEVGTDAVLAHLHFSTEAEESGLLAVVPGISSSSFFISVQIVNASQGRIWHNCLLVKISSIEKFGLRKLTSSFASRGVGSTYWATFISALKPTFLDLWWNPSLSRALCAAQSVNYRMLLSSIEVLEDFLP